MGNHEHERAIMREHSIWGAYLHAAARGSGGPAEERGTGTACGTRRRGGRARTEHMRRRQRVAALQRMEDGARGLMAVGARLSKEEGRNQPQRSHDTEHPSKP